jgi:transcriptional regulator with XRE-family HTH domain
MQAWCPAWLPQSRQVAAAVAEAVSELFGERLHRLRVAKGLSVEDVAQRLGVTHSIVRRAEYGEQMIRAWRLPVLARLLGVSTDYLLTGHDEPLLAALKAQIRQRAPYERLLAMVSAHE